MRAWTQATMLMKSEVEIAPSDTYASLSDKLAQAGAQMIIPALAADRKGRGHADSPGRFLKLPCGHDRQKYGQN